MPRLRGTRAAGHPVAAVARNEALGHWPAVTLSNAHLGQALGRLGDQDAARRLYAEAAAETTACGMTLPVRFGSGRSGYWRAAGGAHGAARTRRPVCAGRDDSVGLRHVAALIANPGVDIPAVRLMQPERPGRPRAAQLSPASIRIT